jgi:hypothetical protein
MIARRCLGAWYDGGMRRETYSSLKAVDGAWRVAMGYMHRRPVDVMRQVCPGCGGELDVMEMGEGGVVVCGVCHTGVKMPGHVVGEVERRRAAAGPRVTVVEVPLEVRQAEAWEESGTLSGWRMVVAVVVAASVLVAWAWAMSKVR